MTELKCKAKNCAYNKEQLCSKGDIMVGGKHAQNMDETHCDSFSKRKEANASNSTCHPSRTISIDCEVEKCVHNSNYKCTAEHVNISGSNADASKETSCGTFKEK